jgi:hypothetical protein
MGEVISLERKTARENFYEVLMRRLIETAHMAGYEVTPRFLYEILVSAPESFKRIADDEWARDSVCSRCIAQADKKFLAGRLAREDYLPMKHFWLRSFIAHDLNLRKNVASMLKLLADAMPDCGSASASLPLYYPPVRSGG